MGRNKHFKAVWISPELHSFLLVKAKELNTTAGEIVEARFPEAPKRASLVTEKSLNLFSNESE